VAVGDACVHHPRSAHHQRRRAAGRAALPGDGRTDRRGAHRARACRVQPPHRHFGRSLLPLLHDAGRAHREYAFTEGGFALEEEPAFERAPFPYDLKTALQHDRPALVGKAIAVRDRKWTYVWRRYEGPELYHRGSDPDERINLADSAGHAGTRQRLHDAIFTWLADTADVLPADADPRSPRVDLPAPGEGRRADP